MIGNYLGPDEAFRFARGETVRASAGERAKLIRPLDFLVVADHSENLGLAPMIAESNKELLRNEWGKMVHDLVKSGDPVGAFNAWGAKMAVGDDPLDDAHHLEPNCRLGRNIQSAWRIHGTARFRVDVYI